ncbi:unnamed protein product [marine sediment metagenome]|uniref:Uncharacterized protein n=1 Tax=marine sediment metagenome TaxID=412755 RepID=X0SAB3_9ZZZZ
MEYEHTKDASRGSTIKVDITDSFITSKVDVEVVVSAQLKDMEDNVLDEDRQTIIAKERHLLAAQMDNHTFSLATKKDETEKQKFKLELWLDSPPGRVAGWHKLDGKSFTVKLKESMFPYIPFISDILPHPDDLLPDIGDLPI